jgi:tRNA-dihydrouridine synthase B
MGLPLQCIINVMLTIGNISIDSPLVLAPMAGISDLPYRLINRSMGCKFAFTEMISVSALAYKNQSTISKLASNIDDSPLAVQIVGRDPEIIKRALETLSEHKFDMLDFNCACPVKKVASKGKGAGMLQEPVKMQNILKTIVESSDVPVTVKIRSGWDDTSVNAVDIALRARDAGVKALTIHGRTRMQGYRGNVDYRIIQEVKKAIDIPVIASGDALTPVLIKKLFDETGCDAVAAARGALGNPWIFPETAAYLKSGIVPARPSAHEVAETMKNHFNLIMDFSGEKVGILRFRKFFSWYTKGLRMRELKVRAFRAGTRDEMFQLIEEVQGVPDAGDISHLREIPVKYNNSRLK